MTTKQQSLHPDNGSGKQQLTQAIIDEMKAQGFLDDFIDEKTGEALLEIQFANETVICQVKPDDADPQE